MCPNAADAALYIAKARQAAPGILEYA